MADFPVEKNLKRAFYSLMKILIEMTHPADVHLFRNAISEFTKAGHTVAVTARHKDVTVELLKNYNIPFTTLSRRGKNIVALACELVVRDLRLLKFCISFKPDILTGLGGICAAHIGFLLRKPVVIWDDTEIATLQHKISYPFATAVYCPDCYYKKLGKKQRFYPGFHQLAYLYPGRFTPDVNVVKNLGIKTDEKYCIVRFVSWQAHHDIGQRGVPLADRFKFVEDLSKYVKVYISSESPLPPVLEKFKLSASAHLMHHILAFASLYIGEGATTAAEAAVLGVPAVYVNTLKLGYINMLERIGLVRQPAETSQVLRDCIELVTDKNARGKALSARQKLLSGKIDVTDFIVKTILDTGRNGREAS